MKKMLAILFAMILALSMLTACGGSTTTTTDTDEAEATTEAVAEEEAEEAEDEEEPYTGDASLDDPLNQDDIGENEILVVSFGTSFNDNRVATIGAIEKAIAEAYPDWSVRRAFTAQIVIDHIRERDGEEIDNVEQALARARENGVKNLVVAPTHLMKGNEYDELMATLNKYNADFDKIAVSEPLLSSDEDKEAVAKSLIDITSEYDKGQTAIVFMGHGTDHPANGVYTEMQEVLRKNADDNYYVGVVHDGAKPDVYDVLEEVKKNDAYKEVLLRDMMVVAGDHATNDMSDPEDPESWASIFKEAGYEVTPILEGLGQVPDIRKIYVEHVGAAVDEIGK